MTTKMFASDNNSGIHPAILEAIAQANDGHVPAYGGDLYTAAAIDKFKEHFGEGCEVAFENRAPVVCPPFFGQNEIRLLRL